MTSAERDGWERFFKIHPPAEELLRYTAAAQGIVFPDFILDSMDDDERDLSIQQRFAEEAERI